MRPPAPGGNKTKNKWEETKMTITTPSVFRETSTGYQRYSVWDMLFHTREVECAGEVTPELAHSIAMQLRWLEREDPGKEITLYVQTGGGSVSAGLAIYDMMQAVSCPVRTVCLGLAASMGAVIFAGGDSRDILPHARVMLHDPLTAGGGIASALQLKREAEDILKVRETLCGILARRTGRDIGEIYEKTAADCYFSAREAVALKRGRVRAPLRMSMM